MLLEEAYPVDEAQRAGALSAADLPMPWTTGAALSSAGMLSACGGGSLASPASAVPPVPAGPETTATPGTTTTGSGGTTTTGTAGTPTTTTTGGGSNTTTTTTTTTTTAGGAATTATTATISTTTSTTTATATATTTGAGVTVVTGTTGSTTPPTVTPTPSPPVTVTAAAITPIQASRFLAQATMGATRATIDEVVATGFDAWLTTQFALPRPTSHWDWLVAGMAAPAGTPRAVAGMDASLWRGMISDPDQLRQRVGMALLDFLVVSTSGVMFNPAEVAVAGYVDVLLDNAFGNFRTLLDAITFNPAMAAFMTYWQNRKADPATGAQPDENYARELMQLFTIGPVQLNMDGTAKTFASGAALETYTQADVSGLARVFTGLTGVPADFGKLDYMRSPLVINTSWNETGAASFLGITVTGGGTAAIKIALDNIFAHPNVPPFVSRQLIQRLVTSNPSPAYVGRVAAVFADNGAGVRGDLKAVIRAILTDMEARGDGALTADAAGKLRAPVLRLTAWARAFGATSPSTGWAIGNTSNNATLGQAMGRSPSVFNWFRPGYTPPNTAIAAAGLAAPEFQITDEQSVVGYVNFMATLVRDGVGDVKPDYTALLAKATDAAALVDEVNLVLAAGQLSAATVATIRGAVGSISASAVVGQQNRVWSALLLTLASPDFLTVK